MKKRQKNLLAILLTMFISFIMPISALGVDKLVVKDGDGTTTFKVEDDGSVAASGNVAIGTTSSSVPLLVQTADTGHLQLSSDRMETPLKFRLAKALPSTKPL